MRGKLHRDWIPWQPGLFLASAMALDAQEIGALSLVVSAIWQRGGPLPDNAGTDRYIAGICNCSVRKWRQIRASLIDLGALVCAEGGLWAPVIDEFIANYGRQPISATLRAFILSRDGERCAYCGSEVGPFHIDHVFPVSRGGTNDAENLTVACVPCNLSKRAKTVSEWRG